MDESSMLSYSRSLDESNMLSYFFGDPTQVETPQPLPVCASKPRDKSEPGIEFDESSDLVDRPEVMNVWDPSHPNFLQWVFSDPTQVETPEHIPVGEPKAYERPELPELECPVPNCGYKTRFKFNMKRHTKTGKHSKVMYYCIYCPDFKTPDKAYHSRHCKQKKHLIEELKAKAVEMPVVQDEATMGV